MTTVEVAMARAMTKLGWHHEEGAADVALALVLVMSAAAMVSAAVRATMHPG